MLNFSFLKSIQPSLISAILSSIITVFVLHSFKSDQNFGTVNITSIVDQFIKAEAEKHLTSDVLKMEANQFGSKLEFTLKALSKEKNVIIFPSEAVIAGMKDYTDAVRMVVMHKDF